MTPSRKFERYYSSCLNTQRRLRLPKVYHVSYIKPKDEGSRLKSELYAGVLALPTVNSIEFIHQSSVCNSQSIIFEAIKMPYNHLDTPQKNKIRGAAEFCEKQGIKYTKASLASTFETTTRQVSYALASDVSRTGRSSISKQENPKKLTERDLDHVEIAIEANGSEGHELDWAELNNQFGFGVHPRTLKDNINERGLYTFIAAEKPYVDEKLAKIRVN